MPCDELRCAEQVYLITKPAEQFNIDIPHTQQLPKIMPPQFSSKKIECEYHKNTSVIIIYKGNDSTNISNSKCCDTNYNSLPKFVFFYFSFQ